MVMKTFSAVIVPPEYTNTTKVRNITNLVDTKKGPNIRARMLLLVLIRPVSLLENKEVRRKIIPEILGVI